MSHFVSATANGKKEKRKLTGDTKSHAEASLGERKIITKVEGKPKAEKY